MHLNEAGNMLCLGDIGCNISVLKNVIDVENISSLVCSLVHDKILKINVNILCKLYTVCWMEHKQSGPIVIIL